jgi:hypothetical protein
MKGSGTFSGLLGEGVERERTRAEWKVDASLAPAELFFTLSHLYKMSNLYGSVELGQSAEIG